MLQSESNLLPLLLGFLVIMAAVRETGGGETAAAPIGKYCDAWQLDSHSIAVATSQRLYLVDLSESTDFQPVVKWPISPTHFTALTSTFDRARQRSTSIQSACRSPIKSVLRLTDSTYEVCGLTETQIACRLFTRRLSINSWLPSSIIWKLPVQDFYSLVVNFADNCLLMAYSPLHATDRPVLVLKRKTNQSGHHLDHDHQASRLWWTNQLTNDAWQTGSVKTQHQFFAIIPVQLKRYVIFTQTGYNSRESPEWPVVNWPSGKSTRTLIAKSCTTTRNLDRQSIHANEQSSLVVQQLELICRLQVNGSLASHGHPFNSWDFNQLIAVTSAPSPRHNDSVIFALFANPRAIGSRLGQSGELNDPLALCVVRTSQIDAVLANAHRHNQRIGGPMRHGQQDIEPESTECHSRSDPRHSGTGRRSNDVQGLILSSHIQPASGFLLWSNCTVSALLVDPNYTDRSVQLEDRNSQSMSILYVGTTCGSVFKLSVLHHRHQRQELSDETSLFHLPLKRQKQSTGKSDGLAVTGSGIQLIRHVYQSPTNRSIVKLFLASSKKSTSSQQPKTTSFGDKLILMDGHQLVRLELDVCSPIATCRTCLEMVDPECYWDQKLEQCLPSDSERLLVRPKDTQLCRLMKEEKGSSPQSSSNTIVANRAAMSVNESDLSAEHSTMPRPLSNKNTLTWLLTTAFASIGLLTGIVLGGCLLACYHVKKSLLAQRPDLVDQSLMLTMQQTAGENHFPPTSRPDQLIPIKSSTVSSRTLQSSCSLLGSDLMITEGDSTRIASPDHCSMSPDVGLEPARKYRPGLVGNPGKLATTECKCCEKIVNVQQLLDQSRIIVDR